MPSADSKARQLAFEPGDVVRYPPGNNGWCRHGIAIVQNGGHGRDTYWSSGDGSYVSSERLAEGELMFRMGEFRSVEHEEEWIRYAEADRQSFPMGGYPRRLFVRAAAEPDLETQIQNAYERLRRAEQELESAGHAIQWAGRDIALLEAKRNV